MSERRDWRRRADVQAATTLACGEATLTISERPDSSPDGGCARQDSDGNDIQPDTVALRH
ncbi:hypothetical protein [Luteimonas marina]|uniref:hypothetical protein n=1 Tax=Luteimonas marina TaxID=488485 RepID=UPI0013153BBF|nr:hypothetical protein [Luteimonas marina]